MRDKVLARARRLLAPADMDVWLQCPSPWLNGRRPADLIACGYGIVVMLLLDQIEADRLLPRIATYCCEPNVGDLAEYCGLTTDEFVPVADALATRGMLQRSITPDGAALYYLTLRGYEALRLQEPVNAR